MSNMPLSIHHRIVLAAKCWLYSRSGEPYHINGKTLRYMPGSRPVRLRYRSSSNANVRFDALQIETLANGIRPGDTVIDIGAHYGQYSIIMAAFAGPSGTVISFEPDPYARKVLTKNFNLNPDLKRPVLEESALSDQDGEAILYSKGGNSQSSLVRSAVEFNAPGSSEAIRIHTTSLDSYLQRNGVPQPSWVKIDVEGAEIRVLRGALNLLAGRARIVLELHPYAWPDFGDNLEDLQRIISRCGRRMVGLGTNQEVGSEVSYGTVLLDAAL
jgi:FkbM family methyltransferase